MSSIYTDNFNTVIKRVYSNPESVKTKNNNAGSTKENFSSLLASVEINKQNQASTHPHNKQDLDRILDKLRSEDSSDSKKLSSNNNYPPSPSIIIGDIPIEEDKRLVSIKSVNSSLKSDKITTPENDIKNILEPKLPSPKGMDSRGMSRDEVNNANKISSGINSKINSPNETQKSMGKDQIKEIIKTAGKFHGVDPHLGLAIAEVESAFDPSAISLDGHESKGVFQLLDSTAMDMKNLSGINEPYDPYDPSMNSFLGVSYLRRLLNIFSEDSQLNSSTKTIAAKTSQDLEKIAVAAYNTGEGNVAKAQARAQSLGKDPSTFSAVEPHLPEITKDYVRKVTSIRNSLSASALESLKQNG